MHGSTKMTPNQASKKANEKEVSSNLQDRRVKQQPKFELGQLLRTADFKRVLLKVIQQIRVINYIQKIKSKMTLFQHIESTFYLRGIIKTCYYQQK